VGIKQTEFHNEDHICPIDPGFIELGRAFGAYAGRFDVKDHFIFENGFSGSTPSFVASAYDQDVGPFLVACHSFFQGFMNQDHANKEPSQIVPAKKANDRDG
jgi:hypothetical protein